ncbi:transketolase family protein [Proteiniclasticum sp. SCR006]|uniref:Transketolase family protein n=1 Tax=Proteiniclasticum aestuarii TaxID=2817862 RepID=A0A939HAP3_9CLOT|nr:transketolase C-terminal domain-containing protein [Proteiniclasticum aestuarii]MBO1264140.1 transketolase family protein [Proteiniclasticum aestuarii]
MAVTVMREVLADTLKDMMEKDERIVVMDADLASANGTFGLRDQFPGRAIDVGISEANMASMAAGMSAYGMKPYIVTFTAFASRRICDQLAISCAYAKQDVKIIATDAGVTAQTNGGTHMSLEDIGIVRSIPGTVVLDMVDGVQLRKALPVIHAHEGVVYVRMVRKDTPDVFDETHEFDLFKGTHMKEGKDLTIIASGIMVHEAMMAEKELKEAGINAEIIAIHCIKPIDQEMIIASARKTGKVMTLENHNIHGGLYSAVAEVLSEHCPVPMKAIGIKDHFGEVGKTRFLMEKYGMTKEDIVREAKVLCEK